METEMAKQILLIAILLAMVPFFVFGQSSGKIVGVAKDAKSGELLPGVNISIEGTTYGAATDVDGYFVILNVPVGVYEVRASFIGYTDLVLKGIRVSAGVTTEQNFSLEETAIEGQAVVVTAQRPLVEKHVTQSVALVTSEELENIPIRGFNNVIATQNSVVVQDNQIYIRGGRPDEVGYYIDGAAAVDPLTNTQSIYVIQEAVEEFQVLAGGYNAEFGGANSGIIKTEMKTGGSKYNFSVDFQTDDFASTGDKFLGTYSYGHKYTIGTLSGPIAGNKVRFFVAAENAYKRDRTVRFSEGFTLTNLVDRNTLNPDVNAGHPDIIEKYEYPDGFTPQRKEDQWAIQGTLLFDFSPLQFRMSGSWSDRSQQFNSFRDDIDGANRLETPMLNVLNQRTFDDVFTNLLLSGRLTYVISPTSLLEGTVSYFNSVLDREDSYFGNEWWKWFDSTAVAGATNGEVTYKNRWAPKEDYLFNGFPFARNGDPYRAYRRQDQSYIGGALNWVTQAGRHHEIKIGGDVRSYTLRRIVISNANAMALVGRGADQAGMDPYTYLTSINPATGNYYVDPIQWVPNAVPNNYGYDIWGREADEDQFLDVGQDTELKIADAPRQPLFTSAYVQDKIEYNDLILNIGLRYDRFDSDAPRLRDPENVEVDLSTGQLLESNWVDSPVFEQVSPRLGFSFPVSDRTVFYMNYGKFVQLPELETMFAGSQRRNYEYVASGFSFQNPVGYGIDPIRTTSYEVGFRQQIGTFAAFDVAGFYRNVKGQVQVDKLFGTVYTFNILRNSDFATTKGLELSLNLRRIQRLQAQLNYTLQNAEGTASTRTTHIAAIEQATQRPTVINPMDYAQTHRGSVMLDYRFGQNDGGPILQNLGANLLFTFNSGHPYTFSQSTVGQANAYTSGTNYMLDPRSRVALEEVGGSTTPMNWNMDFRLDKSFGLVKGLEATVYLRVLNLFNTQNTINVFQATGNAEDDGFYNNPGFAQRQSYLQTYGEDWLKTYEAINIKNGQAYWDELALQLYGNPRQIFLGIKLNY